MDGFVLLLPAGGGRFLARGTTLLDAFERLEALGQQPEETEVASEPARKPVVTARQGASLFDNLE